MHIRILCASLPALFLGACSALVDNFSLADGSTHDDDISLVNGRIEIGSDCRVNGSVKSVNGGIEIGSSSRVLDISNVNGRIVLGVNVEVNGSIAAVNGRVEIGPDSRVMGEIESVNGRITAEEGVVVDGKVSSVNGHIEMTGARVGSIVTDNSSITLDRGVVVPGELRVRKSQGMNFNMGSPPRIVIGRDVRIEGPLTFEREVELYVHESASTGEIDGADAVAYSGEAP